MTLSAIHDRRQLQPVYFADIGGDITTRISDIDTPIPGGTTYQYGGVVGSWDTVTHGGGGIADARYNVPTVRVTILRRQLTGQPLDYTAFDRLAEVTWWTGKSIVIKMTDAALVETGTADSITMFTGVIYDVRGNADTIIVSARGEQLTTSITPLTVDEGFYPDAPQYSLGGASPLIGGLVGFSAKYWSRGRSAASGLVGSTDWRLFCLNESTPEAIVTDDDADSPHGGEVELLISAGEISATDSPDGHQIGLMELRPDGGRVVNNAMLTGETVSGVIFDLGSGQYETSDGTVYIPESDGTEYGSAFSAGQVWVRRCSYPDANDIPSAVTDDWTHPERAFDPTDLDTYASISWADVGAAAVESLRATPFDNDDFIGDRWGLVGPSNGGRCYVVALIYYTGSNDVEIGIHANAGSTSEYTSYSVGVDITANTYEIITHQVGSTAYGNTVGDGGTWGANAADYIFIRCASPADSNTGELRVHLLGLSDERRTSLRELISRGRDDLTPRYRLYFNGYGKDADTSPADVLPNLMIAGSARSVSPIQSSDFYTDSSPAVGSFETWRDDLDASVLANTESGITYEISAIIDQQTEVGRIVASFAEDTFSHVWYSMRDGLWKVRMKDTGLTATGDPLLLDDITDLSRFTWWLTPQAEIVNAVYIDYDYDPRVRRFRRSVLIDHSDSIDWEGNVDTTREVAAYDSQDEFGRNERRIKSKLLRDPAAAWDTCVRMFDTLSEPRMHVSFPVDPGWAAGRDECDVFEMDASIDSICPYTAKETGGSAGSWSGRAFWITKISETPYQPTVIEAVCID